MRYSCVPLLRVEMNAMVLPSGDQRALPSRPLCVSLRVSPVAIVTIQTSRAVRFALKSGVATV